MKAIWVMENIHPNQAFEMQDVEFLVMLGSATQWSRFYPDHERILFCTEDVKEYLKDVLHFWNKIDTSILSEKDNVQGEYFFTASKYKVMRTLKDPFIHIDCDLYFIDKALEENDFEKYDMIVSYLEEENFYHHIWKQDIFKIAGIETFEEDEVGRAWNVSLFYMRDLETRDLYLETMWNWMEKLSACENKEEWWFEGFTFFCEQKILFDLTKHLKIKSFPKNFIDDPVKIVHLGYEKRMPNREDKHFPFRRWQIEEALKESSFWELIQITVSKMINKS